jgi:transposase
MSTTSKSPLRVLRAAHRIGERRLRRYWHRFSPRKFTLPQLFACLVLKEFLRLDYRKLAALLEDAPSLSSAIGLVCIPHFTTFQKAARRLLRSQSAGGLLDETIEAAVHCRLMKRPVARAAIDGTGFETRHISAYFVRRRAKGCKTGYQTTTYTRWPAASLVCDCDSHLVLAVITGRGPGPDDPYFQPALAQAVRRSPVKLLLADAGYDSEAAHVFAREQCGTRTLIPATRGRPTPKPLRGYWRNQMRTRFNRRTYGQRWQAETVNSMIKRTMDSSLRARHYPSQSREIVLRVLTHNIMILRPRQAFLQSIPDTNGT